MLDYERLYLGLFNACTDAIDAIDRLDYGAAKDVLICAQQDAEELYLTMGEEM